MENKEEIKCSIKCAEDNRVITFKITEQYLIEEWKSGLDSGSRYWKLENLSPIVDHYQGHSKQFEQFAIITVSVLALSACIYFSLIHKYIPLLAPFLGIAGLILLYKTVDYGKFRQWTVFRNKDGSTATYLIHCKCSKDEIEKFTECLVETVRKSGLKKD